MNLTLKDLPPSLHSELKERATQHGRSLNKEVLHILSETLRPVRSSPEELLKKIEARREAMPYLVEQAKLEQIIEEGRA